MYLSVATLLGLIAIEAWERLARGHRTTTILKFSTQSQRLSLKINYLKDSIA